MVERNSTANRVQSNYSSCFGTMLSRLLQLHLAPQLCSPWIPDGKMPAQRLLPNVSQADLKQGKSAALQEGQAGLQADAALKRVSAAGSGAFSPNNAKSKEVIYL